ncbi:MAG: hypothetical protein RLY20_876 [Verrucomicrobiota bacterium]|jgi:hypothetical protein
MKRLLLICALLALTVTLSAQGYVKTISDVTVAGTAATVFSSADIVAGSGHTAATGATCAVSTAAIRLTWDGTTPTSSVGYYAPPGQYVFSGTATLLNLQGIRATSTSGTLSCVVYGQ